MDAMLNSMLKYGNKKLISIFTKPQNDELEKSETEKIQPSYSQMSILINSWDSKSDCDLVSTLEEYANAWVDLVN